MELSPEAKRRLDFLITGSWPEEAGGEGLFDTDEAAWLERLQRLYTDVLAAIDSPEELHYYAMQYNWDDAECYRQLRLIVDHSFCDLGTAVALYWIGDPMQAFQEEARPIEQREDRDYPEFMRHLERRIVSGDFPLRTIRIDPKDLFSCDFTRPNSDEEADLLARVPESLKEATPGRLVEISDW